MESWDERETEGWETPRRADCRIPVVLPCPPPPKKKSISVGAAKNVVPPKSGFFDPPDLELLFLALSSQGV
ncbi:hypothetical protein LUZ63_014070 [Rhynchospora breviuscula]|uniref:Uncharacterized protein n=1 Tax=Rhynchospora breviuscula TaxID=2022672 RepID=A0A9Q0C9Z8_9POAL|nr:hypothetical protein LUZ63_014070 [Rhynchospora breviuscula]